MPPGKPFTKVSDEQRAAFGQVLKQDGLKLLKDLGRATVDHLQDHPESAITQTITAVERDTGAVTVVTRGIVTLLRERAARQAAAPKAAAESKSTKSRPAEPIDAEFVEDDPKKR